MSANMKADSEELDMTHDVTEGPTELDAWEPQPRTPEKTVESTVVADATDAVQPAITELSVAISELRDKVERKIADDSIREETIDRLHSELQEHKRGLLEQAVMPLVCRSRKPNPRKKKCQLL